MAWNISNILVNEAIANKKAGGGGGSDLSERVSALEETVGDSSSGLVKDVDDLETTVGDSSGGLVKEVGDLATTVSGLLPNVYSTTETKIGKWGNDDLYRIEVDCGNLLNNASKLVSSGLTGITVKKIYGYAEKSDVTLPIPYIAMSNANCVELYYKTSTNEINITTGSDKTAYSAKVILEYTKNATPENNTRKRGK